MKKWLLIFTMLGLSLAACSKKEDPEPPPNYTPQETSAMEAQNRVSYFKDERTDMCFAVLKGSYWVVQAIPNEKCEMYYNSLQK